MRRLYSTFAHGAPGVGLLILRVVAGIGLIVHGVTALRGGPTLVAATLHVVTAGAGIFLFAGLWTPIAGVLVALIELWSTFSQPGDSWIPILLGTLGAALALLGPGAWSIDARLFGWKSIDFRERKK